MKWLLHSAVTQHALDIVLITANMDDYVKYSALNIIGPWRIKMLLQTVSTTLLLAYRLAFGLLFCHRPAAWACVAKTGGLFVFH